MELIVSIYNEIYQHSLQLLERWRVSRWSGSSFMHASKMVSKGAGGGKSRNMNISIGLLRPKEAVDVTGWSERSAPTNFWSFRRCVMTLQIAKNDVIGLSCIQPGCYGHWQRDHGECKNATPVDNL